MNRTGTLAAALLACAVASPAAAQIESRIPIALFVVPGDEASVEPAAVVEHLMGENIGVYRGFKLVPPEAVLSAAEHAKVDKKRQEARTRLQKGKSAYENLDLDEAVKRLGAARTGYEQQALFVTGQREYLDVLAHLGAAQVLGGNDAAGIATFRRMLQLSPTATLDAQVFPPKILERFAAAQREARGAPRCLVTVEANIPGARVYVDGAFRGVSPVRAEDLACGEHYVGIQATGYQAYVEKVTVGAGEVSAAVSVQMMPHPEGEKMIALLQSLAAVPAGDAVPEPLHELGRWFGADQAIAAIVRKSGDQVTVTAGVYDLMGRARIKAARQTFARHAPGFAGDIDVFTSSLYLDIGGKTIATFTGHDEEPDARRAAPGKRAAPGEPVYAKWWFWVGVAAAVGAAVVVPVVLFTGKGGGAAPDGRGGAFVPGVDPFNRP